MKAILICPAERAGATTLAEHGPLAIVPLLGKSVLEYWLEALAARGVERVLLLASDRPQEIRAIVGDGSRWGLKLDLEPQSHELSRAEARSKYGAEGDETIVLDRLPGQPERPLFDGPAAWYAAVQSYLPRAVGPGRIGVRQVQPGIWVGLHAQIAPTAQLRAPCWIGERTLVGEHAIVGPGAILEDRVIVERGATVAESIVGPESFVGEHISVCHSLAQGSQLVDWRSGSCLHVPDAFFLCSLDDRRFAAMTPSLAGRALAAAAMLATSPVALAIMLLSLVRGDSPLATRLGVRPLRRVRSQGFDTFVYRELTAGRNWLRRWPQFWSVVRGDLTWVGNRPLRPTQAQALANDFERLWLAAPVGLVSLADAHGCGEEVAEATCAHATFYAVNASRRLNCFVLTRTFFLAAAAWPIRWSRRRQRSVALPQLVPKQET